MKVIIKFMQDGVPKYFLKPWEGATCKKHEAYVYNLELKKDVSHLKDSWVLGSDRDRKMRIIPVS